MSGVQFDDDQQEPIGAAGPAAAPAERNRETRNRRDERDDRSDRTDREEPARSHRNLTRSLARGIGRNGASESLTKSHEAFKEYIENYPDDSVDGLNVADYAVLRLERSEHRLDLSSLIFVQFAETAEKKYALFYTLLLAGSNTNLPPLRDADRDRGRRRGRDRDRDRAEIPRTPGDVYDETYADIVYDLVDKKFGKEGYVLVEAGSHVLDAGINLEKDRDALEGNMFYINAAIETQALAKTGTQDPFSLNWLTLDDSLVVDMDWSGEQLHDVNNNPQRADVLIQSTANLDDDEDDRVYNENLTKTAAFFELIYSPAEEQRGFRRSSRRSRDEEETQLVTPLAVISVMDTNFKAVTRELTTLGLATTAPLSNDLTWTRAFTEPSNHEGVNHKDIGALNILVQDGNGKYLDVSKLSERDALEYFGTLCRPDLAYALEIPERGELTWLHEDYIAAAEGDRDALENIMASNDALFDNQFSAIFRDICKDMDADKNPFVLGDRVMNGWYRESRDGEKKPLSNIGLLWWLNRTGEKDHGEDALDWADLFDNSNESEEVLIEKRLRMLQSALGHGNVHVTGYSRQVLVDISYIQALAEAAAACEVHIQAAVNQQVGVDRRGRGNRRIISMAGSDAGSKMFSSRSRRRNRDDDGDDDRRSRRRTRRR